MKALAADPAAGGGLGGDGGGAGEGGLQVGCKGIPMLSGAVLHRSAEIREIGAAPEPGGPQRAHAHHTAGIVYSLHVRQTRASSPAPYGEGGGKGSGGGGGDGVTLHSDGAGSGGVDMGRTWVSCAEAIGKHRTYLREPAKLQAAGLPAHKGVAMDSPLTWLRRCSR